MGSNDSPATRRTVLKSLGAGVGLAALAGCTGGTGGGGDSSGDGGSGGSSGDGGGSSTDSGGSGGGQKATVRVAGTGGSWGEARAKSFYDPFRNGELAWSEPHNLDFSSVASEKYTADLKRNPENPAYDAVELDGQRAALLGQNDAVLSQKEHLDNWSGIPAAYKNEYMGGTVAFPRGLAWRNDMVDKEFSTWDDLIDPDLAGKVGFEPWNNAGSKYFYVINHIKGGSLDDLEPGLNWLRDFVETTDPIIFDSIDQALKLFQNGDMVAAPFLSARTENLELDEGLDMGWSVPEGGAPLDFWGYPITKHNDPARQEQAKVYAEGCLHPETQAGFAESFGYPPCATEATEYISEEAKENHPMLSPTEEQLARYDLDIDWVQAAQQQNQDGEEFRKVIAGG
jgi:spermidine/putrescine-binding protein